MRAAGWTCLVVSLLVAPARAEPVSRDYPLGFWLGFLEDPPLNRRTMPVLMRALNSPGAELRVAAARVLGYFDRLPAEMAARLRQLADDDSSSAVRRSAILALCRQPGAVRPAEIDELIQECYSQPEIRSALAASWKTTLPHLLRALSSNSFSIRAGVLDVLAHSSADVASFCSVLPHLKELAQKQNGDQERVLAARASLVLVRVGMDRPEHLKTFFRALGRHLIGAQNWLALNEEPLVATLVELLPFLGDADISPLLTATLSADHASQVMVVSGVAQAGMGPAAVSVLVWELGSSDETVWERAADGIKLLSLGDVPSLESSLRQALRAPDLHLASRAAAALAQIGRADDTVKTRLLRDLESGDQEMRILAAQALRHCGQQAEHGLALAQALKDETAAVRRTAAHTLMYFGAGGRHQLPALQHCCLHDPDLSVRRTALATFGVIMHRMRLCGDQTPVVLPLVALLYHPESALRKAAMDLLRDVPLGQERSRIIPALTPVLENADHPLQEEAAMFLADSSDAAVPYLARLLQSPDDRIRTQAFRILRLIEADSGLVLPLFRQLLNDRSAEMRKATYRALKGRGDSVLATALLWDRVACLRGEEREEARQTFFVLGVPDPSSLPDLLLRLKDAHPSVRENALRALLQAPGGVVPQPELVALLGDQVTEIQHLALEGLIALGPPAIPDLLRALDHVDQNVRYRALTGLGDMPRLPAEALQPLLRKLKSTAPTGRCGIPVAYTQARAAVALGKLGEAGAPAVPDLTAALRHPDADVRACASRALGAIGQPAHSAEAELKALRRDNDEPVRRAAAKALGKLNGEGRRP
jgi:HEAT repeat protein